MTRKLTSASATATTATKPSVSRPWNVRGVTRRAPPRTTRGIRSRRARSALGEGVADTTDRHDEARLRRVILELVAQVAHMDVDRLLVLIERLVVAEQLQELRARV